ncbi:MAG: hypothetical protein GX491_20365 [Chloroflexi bacterium]|nr:hypothetical protein [Chloroflexota bacterium]
MPDLEHTLQGRDLGFLRIVAGTWGLELNAPDAATALPVVVQGILEHADFAEVIEALPQDAKNVLHSLMQNEGHILWAAFIRKFGEVRRMGSARRDRERPDLKPASAAEVLWYRGLIGRAFLTFSPDDEPQEYAYIPDDLLPLMPTLSSDTPPPLGRPASPVESAHPTLASDRILDDACTLLAALRLKMDEDELASLSFGSASLDALKGILQAARLLDYDGLPHPERTRAFLEAPRGEALAQLAQAWMEDKYFNELRLLPGLKFEGDWTNDPLRTRQVILELVGQIPENRWWSLPAFVTAIHEQQPDFQRPAGDYDSWFIRQESSGSFLRGFSAWDDVDGALVRFLICGPMHWLGLLDLAAPELGAPPTALRLSRWAAALWNHTPPDDLPAENAPLQVNSDGRIILSSLTPRAVRYQVARFCHWNGEKTTDGKPGLPHPVEYHYRITPASLERAKAQGLRPSQLLGLLRRHSESPLPPSIIQALERWENAGTQARIEQVVILRVASPEILSVLRKTRAARFLGDALNETTILLRPGTEDQVLNALAESGYFAEIDRLGESGQKD